MYQKRSKKEKSKAKYEVNGKNDLRIFYRFYLLPAIACTYIALLCTIL